MKSINAIQKDPHIIESSACILWIILVVMFLFPMNFLISFGMYSTAKPFSAYSAIQWVPTDWVPIDWYSSRFIIFAPSFILDKLFLE